jgi:L-fuculose-phosphate aldolase
MDLQLRPVGFVHSPLTRREEAPKQGREGAPSAEVRVSPEYSDALFGLKQGSRLVLLTWLHQADRQLLQVHPRGDTARPRRGVFSTRSPDRPNPIGLHEVTVTAIQDNVLRVEPLEAIDGTPVLDIKPLL